MSTNLVKLTFCKMTRVRRKLLSLLMLKGAECVALELRWDFGQRNSTPPNPKVDWVMKRFLLKLVIPHWHELWKQEKCSSLVLDYFNIFRLYRISQKCPVRDSSLWMLQFLSQINKQYLKWKLTSSAKTWDLSEVTEAHSLASGGFRRDRGQNEKNLRQKLAILGFSPKIFFHFDLVHFQHLLRQNYALQWPHWGLKF